MVCEGRVPGALGASLDFVMVWWDVLLVSWRCLSGVLLAATNGMEDKVEGCAGCVPINDTYMLRDAITSSVLSSCKSHYKQPCISSTQS